TLSWSSSNATSCNYGGTSGSETIGPYSTTGNRSFTVTCTGPGGSDSDSETLHVQSYPAPTMSFSVSPSVIAQGDTATWSWGSSNADYCTFEGYTFAASGSTVGGPYNVVRTKNYTASCFGPG